MQYNVEIMISRSEIDRTSRAAACLRADERAWLRVLHEHLIGLRALSLLLVETIEQDAYAFDGSALRRRYTFDVVQLD